jgi:hypothetical protein
MATRPPFFLHGGSGAGLAPGSLIGAWVDPPNQWRADP